MTLLRRIGGAPGDRGAVAALVSVLLGGGVLLGMAALTIDVGLLYAEREELQSGADAAAVAVAKVCVGGNDRCTHGRMGRVVDRYADRNAHDRASNATVCGFAPDLPDAANLLPPTCGGGSSGLTDCLGDTPSSSQPYVEVRTDTRTPRGGNVLPPVFAQTVTGTTGTDVHACSRVSWGPVEEAASDDTLGIAISENDFDDAIDDGSGFQPPPGGGPVSSRGEVALTFRTPSCAGGPGGGGCGGPGGFGRFGFLTGRDCSPNLRVGAWRDGQLTPETPSGCADRLRDVHDNETPIAVAIFDDTSSTHFQVSGIAVFVVTGWRSPPGWSGGPGEDHSPMFSSTSTCSGPSSTFCIYGYFTTRVFETGTGALGDDHYGAVYVRTIG